MGSNVLKGKTSIVSVTPGEQGDQVSLFFPAENVEVQAVLDGPVTHVQEHADFVFLATASDRFIATPQGGFQQIAAVAAPPPAVALTREEIDKLEEERKKIEEDKLKQIQGLVEQAAKDGLITPKEKADLDKQQADLKKEADELKKKILQLRVREAAEELKAARQAIQQMLNPNRQAAPKAAAHADAGKKGDDSGGGSSGGNPTGGGTSGGSSSSASAGAAAGAGAGSGSGSSSGGGSDGTDAAATENAHAPLDLSKLSFVVLRGTHDVWVWNPFRGRWDGHLSSADEFQAVEKVDGLAIARTATQVWVWNPLSFAWNPPLAVPNGKVEEVKQLA